ncbi:Hypothetical predicted protein [Paramuricea clavata]|uniref:Uncharacterized protein n=1 Tax=Paramuricea clavata TaxID=317549 RepID=A0A6S7J8Y9_PARCT|nr:Hypothetical predicted protein [Paramuricea clavata]
MNITVYVEDGGVTLDLQNPLILTHGSELYVKNSAVFWKYKNFRKGFNDYISVDGKKITIDEGYWTFKQLRKELEENGLTLKEYPDGRIRIDFAKGTNSAGLRNLTSILGYRSSNGFTYTPRISDRSVDIHEGLRYLTVSCNLVNREHNIGPYGNRSTVITSLPIDVTRPLFGTTTKYNDIESQVRVDAGKYSEISV